MFKLAEDFGAAGTPYRDAFNNTLIDVIKNDDRVYMLEADLGGASGTLKIQKECPGHFVEMGISEQDMMGTAAGMSSEGLIPFVHTFGPFATRRAFDRLGLDYRTVDLTHDPTAAQTLRDAGFLQAPLRGGLPNGGTESRNS